MGDENPIRTLGDYSKPSHKGYRNTMELPVGKNVAPLRSDTIRLVQNRCSFHGLRSEDPNQHLKDFLKLVDSLDLDDENREIMRLRTAKLRNDILMFQQHHGESLSKLRDLNAEEFWALLEDPSLYDNESWNDPRDFAKPVKAIALPQDVPSTSDRRLIELENQYCTEDPEQAFVEYASSRTDEAGGLVSEFKASQDARLSKFEANFKRQQGEMINKIDTVLKAITDQIAGTPPSNAVKNPKLGTTLAHFKEANTSQTITRQPEIENKPSQPEEPEPTLKDEFQDLHLNLPVLEVLAHASIYNAILDKYVESLELGSCINIIPLYIFKKLNIRLLEKTYHIFGLADETKSYPVRIVKDVEVHIGKLKLLNNFYVLDMKKDPETPLIVGRGFLATANAVIDCRMAKIVVGEGITRSVFGVKGVDLGKEKAPYWTTLGKRESYKPRPSSDGIGTNPSPLC
ncbi:MAK10-like protein [Tanacetum coccineum]